MGLGVGREDGPCGEQGGWWVLLTNKVINNGTSDPDKWERITGPQTPDFSPVASYLPQMAVSASAVGS